MTLISSCPEAVCTKSRTNPLYDPGRNAVIVWSLHDEICSAYPSDEPAGDARTWHPEHGCPKPEPLTLIVVPDSTTHPGAFGKSGATPNIMAANFARCTL